MKEYCANAVETSDIEIEGITVLAGLDGTGKSRALLECTTHLERYGCENCIHIGTHSDQACKTMFEKKCGNVEWSGFVSRLISSVIKGTAYASGKFKGADGCEMETDDLPEGFKLFAYLQILVNNGRVNDKTLLALDYPEAYMHPSTIVELAKVLVLINKKLGSKIVLTTNSPDLTEGLCVISETHNVKARFYLSESTDKRFEFRYKDCGSEITHLFHSFNNALMLIETYGCTK